MPVVESTQRRPSTGAPPELADVCRHGERLAATLLDAIDPTHGGFVLTGTRRADPAAHQLLWQRHMASGAPEYGHAVIASLRAICGSSLVDHTGGGVYSPCSDDASPKLHLRKTLHDNAQFLELLTWVWRVCRCPQLRRCAERIVGWAAAEMRMLGVGFATSVGSGERDETLKADGNGLMLVALVEAGSVFERRDWLALAREVFDEIILALADGGMLAHSSIDGRRGAAGRLDDYAMMSRAAMRLFEAFGKRRYLDHAEAWVATLDAAFRDADGGYRASGADLGTRSRINPAADGALPSGNAMMIGVLARLNALAETPRYAGRAVGLVEILHPHIIRAGATGATAVANVLTAARLVSIEVSGDPRLPETRELMRIALDCGLPDRLVLGPGAGGTPGERPYAHVGVGGRRLAPIGDAARLRTTVAPGGVGGVRLLRNS